MRKKLSLILVTLFALMLALAACGTPEPEETPAPSPDTEDIPDTPPVTSAEAAYVKLTPQEAEEMMHDGVVILDVRTQEEFDEGHIRNAVLLPDYEVAERAGEVLPDKAQTILIYCRTGRRSELAARALIELGYTKVYDFGGIEDWPGDIVTPFEETIKMPVSAGQTEPELHIKLECARVSGYTENDSSDRQWIKNETTKLTISSIDESFVQEITDISAECNIYYGSGLFFRDWNFDGYMDISLQKTLKVSNENHPHYFWLWDNTAGKFVENIELEEMSNSAVPYISDETKRVVGVCSPNEEAYYTRYYEFWDGKLVLVESETVTFKEHGKRVYHQIIEELIDGEMIVTKDYYEEFDD